MRLASLESNARPFIGLRRGDGFIDLNAALPSLLARDVGTLLSSAAFDLEKIEEAASSASRAVIDAREVRYKPILAPAGKVL